MKKGFLLLLTLLNGLELLANETASQLDSVAKYVNPQADVRNPIWWIAIIITIILGIAYFVIRHYFKGIILDGKPKPAIKFLEGKEKKDNIFLIKTENVDIDKLVAQRVQVNMKLLEQKYHPKCTDPYQDMSLIFQANFNAAQNYNADVEDYLDGMRLYYSRTLKDQIFSDYLKKIDFVIYAKGKKKCENLIIEIVLSGDNIHAYAAESRKLCKAKHDVAPEKNMVDRSDHFYAFFPNEQEEYEYGDWRLIDYSIISRYNCQTLVSGFPNEDIIPSFYVDTRFEQEIIVNWKINGADIPEAGINGKLKLTVKNKK